MVDAVITDLEMQLETPHSSYGHFVAFTFIDILPSFPRVKDMLEQVQKRADVNLIDYNYSTKIIDENTDISYYEVTKH